MEEQMPHFIQDIDWNEFKQQRKQLYLLNDFNNVDLDGIIALCDAICDYAVDIGGLDEDMVYLSHNE